MTNLSPQAQAVLDAVHDVMPYTSIAELLAIVAALRAAADQVVPDEPHPEESQFWDDEGNREWQSNQHFRKQLLAIANELDNLFLIDELR